MELMLAVSVLIASLGWGYSAIHTHTHAQGEAKYKSLWEGMLEAAGQLAQEKADVEKENADLNNALREVDRRIATLADEIPEIQKPVPQNSDEHPVWKFAESNDDLMSAWELATPGMARRPKHMRESMWFTFCANLPELTRKALEDAVKAASL